MREIVHFRLDFICKVGQISAVSTPLADLGMTGFVTDFVVKFDYNKNVVGAANRLC